jgi:hypothetical protein
MWECRVEDLAYSFWQHVVFHSRLLRLMDKVTPDDSPDELCRHMGVQPENIRRRQAHRWRRIHQGADTPSAPPVAPGSTVAHLAVCR